MSGKKEFVSVQKNIHEQKRLLSIIFQNFILILSKIFLKSKFLSLNFEASDQNAVLQLARLVPIQFVFVQSFLMLSN